MTVWFALLSLAAVTYLFKSAGPLLLGGRELPPVVDRLAELLPAPLLAALVVVATFTDAGAWRLDARAVGLAVAAIALWRRAPFVLVVVLAAAATAAARAVGA